MRFQDKKVMVTGGANGIGRAAVLEFAREGAAVMIVDIDAKAAEATAAEVRKLGGIAQVSITDISDKAAVAALFATVAKDFAPLDVAVNCAGAADGNVAFDDIKLSQLRHVLAVNVEGLFLSLRGELRLMRKQGHGAIVNVAGQLAHEGRPNFATHATAAHAIAGLTKTAALEAARDNVRVNAVSPGFVDTAMLKAFFADRPAELAALADTLPTGRLQTAEQVARAILFLASDDAAQYIGQSLQLDGGLSGVHPPTLWVYPKLATNDAA